MRPEAAAGAREARGRAWPCPADGPRRPPSPRGPESPTPWRPWTLTPRDAERTGAGSQLEPGGGQPTPGSKGAFGFQHPVRLYLPISKRREYLQSSGEKVLASFPVQATIHFYNDDSESDSEDGEQEEARGPGAESPGDTERPGGQLSTMARAQLPLLLGRLFFRTLTETGLRDPGKVCVHRALSR
ncbi:protein ripply3 [Myotis daubentonii]|uniref:protein ripply3 n=1 Tax=Myotis daubentonii TaxID=98922 RepID=UPI002873436E|nr:protein ripply3 [Myotis daubentonii]